MKALQRALAAGMRGVQLEDLMQEASIAWLLACKSYDPARGVPFLPFLKRGLQFHINRWLKYEIDECHNASASYDMTIGDDDSAPVSEIIADARHIPQDEQVSRKQNWTLIASHLSPLARRYIELLESPPPELMAELKAVMAKAERGRAMGLTRFAPVRVSSDLIFRIMGLNNYERAKITKEVQKVIESTGT